MSENPSVVTERHFQYVAERTVPDDPFLGSLKEAARAAGIPAIWISTEQASFLQILLRVARAKEVVEVGTLAGYSAITMARALPAGGRLRTIEYEPKHAAFSREWCAKAGTAAKIEVFEGAGMEVLPKFETGSADAAFLDADKKSYPQYLAECLRIVRPGGLILVDNAFAFGQLFDEKPTDREVGAIRAFNDHMAEVSRGGVMQSVIVPVGDGLWVGVKL